MEKINISTLKAHLSESLKKVREGSRILVIDRNTPIAEIIPFNNQKKLEIREPVKQFRMPVSDINIETDPVEYLKQDRNTR